MLNRVDHNAILPMLLSLEQLSTSTHPDDDRQMLIIFNELQDYYNSYAHSIEVTQAGNFAYSPLLPSEDRSKITNITKLFTLARMDTSPTLHFLRLFLEAIKHNPNAASLLNKLIQCCGFNDTSSELALSKFSMIIKHPAFDPNAACFSNTSASVSYNSTVDAPSRNQYNYLFNITDQGKLSLFKSLFYSCFNLSNSERSTVNVIRVLLMHHKLDINLTQQHANEILDEARVNSESALKLGLNFTKAKEVVNLIQKEIVKRRLMQKSYETFMLTKALPTSRFFCRELPADIHQLIACYSFPTLHTPALDNTSSPDEASKHRHKRQC